MTIDRDYIGGNIHVLGAEGDMVRVENELRDTQGDWFYWAFRVRGATGRTLTFDFGDKAWVGPWGAAVSHDGVNWTWGGAASEDGKRFTYAFAPDEAEVYFCHDLHYAPARFERAAVELKLSVQELTVSRGGGSVPYVTLGAGERRILLTARHHACESTGDYVMEGFLREFAVDPLASFSVLAVPFVDYDGVIHGDQGKNRAPHDHNRDYTDAPIYPEVRAIKALAEQNIYYALDLHSPWHRGNPGNPEDSTDYIHLVRKNREKQALQDSFSALFERETARDPRALRYEGTHDVHINTLWNQEGVMKSSCGAFYAFEPRTRLAVTVESPYYGLAGNVVTAEALVEEGRCLYRALREFHREHGEA